MAGVESRSVCQMSSSVSTVIVSFVITYSLRAHGLLKGDEQYTVYVIPLYNTLKNNFAILYATK